MERSRRSTAIACLRRSRGSCAYTRTLVSRSRRPEPLLIEVLSSPCAPCLRDAHLHSFANEALRHPPRLFAVGKERWQTPDLIDATSDELGLGYPQLAGAPFEQSLLALLDIHLLSDHACHYYAKYTSRYTSSKKKEKARRDEPEGER